AKAPAKNYHFIFKTQADEGSVFFERKSNLEWVEEIENPVRIDISSNWLTNVDLQPLESCTELEYLSLAVNKLESVDLTPLQNLKKLRHLDLSHNRLKSIDFTPIAGCENLVYLYLQENKLSEVNIAPLFGLKQLTTAVIQLVHRGTRPRIVIDSYMSNVPPHLNDILFSFYTGRRAGDVPDWLYEKKTEVEYSPRPYSDLVAKFGWAGVKKHLVALSKKLKLGVEFTAQKILLGAFGMPELACFDGSVREIVKFLPTSGSYEEGVLKLYSDMVNLLEAQLKRGGSTLYFDTDTLSTTPGIVLLPSVLSRRSTEIQEVVLFDQSGNVDLLPLWLTSYGHNILKALGYKRYVANSRISEINNALKGLNHELVIEKVLHDERKDKTQHLSVGQAIQSHVRQTVAT
ncbi:MAG: leucine-rich repeat domain-containing protein, partial [Candidatus Thorarchaeota archaeon]